MRNVVRAVSVAVLALVGVVLLALSVTVPTTVQLLASYALKGTQIPVLNVTSDQAISEQTVLFGGVHGVTSPVYVVSYPASFRPFSTGGFSDPTWNQSVAAGVSALRTATAGDPAPVIFGFSQGAVVGSQYKKAFNEDPVPGAAPTWVLLGNGERPNGGVLARFAGLHVPFLDVTTTGATPTYTVGATPGDITTHDITGQYDPISDFPTNPFNFVSLGNALMGALFVHLDYANADPNDAILQDEYGDTAYYLIATYPVPLLKPIALIPIVGPIAADILDPLVRLMVEAGYDRTISPGQPTPANFTYFPNPVDFGAKIIAAIATGIDNGAQDLGLQRPLGTTRPDIGPGSTGQGAYGIGGPPVTPTTTTNDQNVPLMQQQTLVDSEPAGTSARRTLPALDDGSDDPSESKPRPQLNVVKPPLLPTAGDTSTPSTPPEPCPVGVADDSVVDSFGSAPDGPPDTVGADAGAGAQDASESSGDTSPSG